jgi:multiple sugar transport system substrate-binding protein
MTVQGDSNLGRTRRRAPYALAAGMAALSLVAAACGSSSSKSAGGSSTSTGGSSTSAQGASSGAKATVTFLNWADAETATTPGINKMIAQFEQLYPNITVKAVPVSYTDVEHQALLQYRSGNAPDVAEMQGNYTFDLAAAGALQPLDSFANSSYTSSIIPSELNLGRINGSLLAIPWTVAPFGLWYNKVDMQKAGLNPNNPPKTLDQLLSDAAAIKAHDPNVIPIGTDTTNRTYGLDQNWPFMKTEGAQPFSGTTASANTPGMIAYLNFMQQIGKNNYTTVNQLGGKFRDPAAHNDVAFDVDGPYLEGVVISETKETAAQFAQTWGLTTLPVGTTGKAYSTPTDHQLVMFKAAKNKQAAWTFMKWLSTSDYAVSNYTIPVEESIPPLTQLGTQTQSLLASDPFYNTYIKDILPTVVLPPWGPAYTAAYTPIMDTIQQVMTSGTSPASAAKSLQSQLQSALAGAS